MVEPIPSPAERQLRARTFQLELGNSAGLGHDCPEFPSDADPVLEALTAALRGPHSGPQPAQPPAPAVAPLPAPSSSGSTNSDSGIGWREEASQPQVGSHYVQTQEMRLGGGGGLRCGGTARRVSRVVSCPG